MNSSVPDAPISDPSAAEPPLEDIPATVYTFGVDADGTLSFPYVSAACAALFGFDPESAMADFRLMHNAVHQDDRASFDRAGQHSLRTLEPVHWGGRIVRSDGSTRAVVITSQPRRLPDHSTQWHGVVVEHPRRPNDKAEAGIDLAEQQVDVLAMLGHDVATPLTAVMASAEMALHELNRPNSGPDLDAVRTCLDIVLRQSRRLDDIREDLLSLVAADADAIMADPETVDVLPYLRAVADIGHDLTMTIDCDADLYCTVQPTHLFQMLSNLVSNAVRYADTEVALSASETAGRVLISVRDDGPGVPPEVTGRLFRRFSHAGVTRRPVGAGTGLGLYIVRTLATANRGTVLYTPSDVGARFTIALPAAAKPNGD